MRRILIGESSNITSHVLDAEFSRMSYQVTICDNSDDVLKCCKLKYYDMVLLDMQLHGESCLEILKYIRSELPDTFIIVTTAFASVANAVEVMKCGANDYVTKPYEVGELLKKVSHVFSQRNSATVERQIKELEKPIQFYGDNPLMKNIKDIVQRVSDFPTTVLITGESGTGKTTIAKDIHYNSIRAELPFVHVSCAAIPTNLIESELFGYEKGSFTGAVSTHKGKFELADKGTIFLDEIGLMPYNLQAKLLNVIQERKYERIGGIKGIPLNARIIAATNANLEQCIMDGSFRSDLYYRLNVVRIEVPPLRYRKEDIKRLTYLFIKRFSASFAKPIEHITLDFWSALLEYKWPGNIRELENAIESAIALCDGTTLDTASLPMHVTQNYNRNGMLDCATNRLKSFLGQQEIVALTAALEKFDGNRDKTAQYLGISIRTLRYKMRSFNISTHGQDEEE